MPLDPTISALAGTAVGAAATWLIERTRWKRQYSVRWDEVRFRTYSDTFASMRAFQEAMRRAARSDQSDLPSEERWKDAHQHLAEVLNRIAEMMVISSSDVYNAATGWVDAVSKLAHDGRQSDNYETNSAEALRLYSLF
ncbi:MAG TPA: hypothetical protein VGW38_28625, partial [Chloroflexota bacterium]|nr:hypothetical protein [Chloroflexota bacterium]